MTLTNRPVSGLCSSSGAIVLSWPDTSDGAQRPDDGVNVVLHAFAHQLDKLQRDVAQGLPSLISAYGATKPAEFFAVVTELFFEKPAELQREHPALYAEFRQYYRQDPVQRFTIRKQCQ